MRISHEVVHTLLSRLGVSVGVNLGVDADPCGDGDLSSYSPIDGSLLARVRTSNDSEVQHGIAAAHEAFLQWRIVPAPRRGELIRLFGEELRAEKEALAKLITLEVGKITSEGLGEVQEMIDICDFSVGQSRQLYGLTMVSERPGHRMMETWHPLGVVGVISAFNFPVAVWSWNFALAIVCGNPVVWKPSEKAPLTSLACQALFERAVKRFGDAPKSLLSVLQGGRDVGEMLLDDTRVALVSATGSTRMGRAVGSRVAARFGRSLLELGGNNAVIVTQHADLDNAVRGILFSAVGTTGQRCTSTRRLIVHTNVCAALLERLKSAYGKLVIGDPLESATLLGPLIDGAAFESMRSAIAAARADGGEVIIGGERVEVVDAPDAYYVQAAIIVMPKQTHIVRCETFAPILYVLAYDDFNEAIRLHNEVPQGLSSAIFTNDMREAEEFMSAAGSDCGIINVNIGTSGAEIGGAFGGNKETGGGRESGSDAWRGYMRRATNTVNYSHEMPLSQGVTFDL